MSRLFPRLDSAGDDVALKVGAESFTTSQLAAEASALRELLATHGVTQGQHVAVWTQPSPETPAALIALAAAGFVVVPIDPKLGPL
ncbi:MAG: AMP-binding protein, partial [Archangium sp.]